MEKLQQRRKTPSFSSSLLDSVLRSIDESSSERKQLLIMSKKQGGAEEEEEMASARRAMMIEKWIRKQSGGTDGGLLSSVVLNSGSSSSESSSGGMFSSSEAETSSGGISCFTPRRSRCVPAAVSAGSERSGKAASSAEQRNSAPKLAEKYGGRGGGGGGGSGGFTKTKSKALKFYGELKKVNQPISPGRRIANFLNSLFSSGNARKAKMCPFETVEDMNSERKALKKSVQASTSASSASSFSRSCLSKSPSSSSRNKLKRSVRFYPVSVIVDEDCRPCGHKCLYEDDPSLMPELTAKNFQQSAWLNEKNTSLTKKPDVHQIIREYQKKISHELELTDLCHHDVDDEDDDDDDDDAESYSSSDLFELDHIVIGRYQEELPVYGTTYLATNHSLRT